MWLLPLFSLFLGLAIAHGIELQHQALHYTGFKNRNLNVIVGNLFGLLTLNSFTHYQILHNWHHQKIGTADDIEFFLDHRIDVRLSTINLLKRIFRIYETYRLIIQRFFSTPELPEKVLIKSKSKTNSINFELFVYRFILIIFCLATAFGIISPIILLNWVIAVGFYHVWHFLFEFPEHYLCATSDKSIYRNTRSITGNAFSRYISFNNFHVEHHLFPKAPMDHLILIHNEISGKIEHKNKSYLEFYYNCVWSSR
ncbi:MAG: fatty acid desaturase family protein [Neobacillus sp.]